MKVTIANAMPTVNRGRTSEPNPLQGLVDKIMEDGKPRHIICDDADEVTKVKNLLRKGFLAHNAALKTAKDAEKEFAFYAHFGPRVKRGPRKSKETAAATETVTAEG